jgi:uncharacterized protein (DUF885 family)
MNRLSGVLNADSLVNTALRIVDEAWEELQRRPSVQQQLGVRPARLADVSFAEADRRSTVGRSLLKRLDAEAFEDAIPHDLALTLRLVRFNARMWSREADWYWTVIDPIGGGFFGMFLPTAYCGGFLLDLVQEQFAGFAFAEPADTDRYLALVADYARLLGQFSARTAGQAERGVWMPRAQVAQARALLETYRSAASGLHVASERLGELGSPAFVDELERHIVTSVVPAFDRALNGLSEAYLAQAPHTVGLGQYPGGAAVYAELVQLHTTLDLTVEEIHRRGHERMAAIEASMQAIRAETGLHLDRGQFLEHLEQDRQWRASTVEDVTARFQVYIDRLKPHLSNYFSELPRSTYGVTALPEALQGSMTYGYYDMPRRGRPHGRYLFNSATMTKKGLFQIGSLIYHELMPGHHLQLALQQENESLHPLRRYSFLNAYNEGWAEYAAHLAGEMGMYEDPAERYGRLLFDALFTCRLVVDTGMNALGWSLQEAQDYMRQHSAMSETEIRTETLRYSCDIPAQALAYKIGDTHILRLRARMRSETGSAFQLKDFHAAVLEPGGLPLTDLQWHVDYEIERLKRQ